MGRTRNRVNQGDNMGVFSRCGIFGSKNGFGTLNAIKKARNKYKAQMAMYNGEPFVCESPKYSGQVNVYGVSRQVSVFDAKTAEKAAHAILDFVDNGESPEVIDD
jgi:hypothetical protein